ncbi:MAG TPA: hypothetical protein VFS65_02060 [Candidatus Saccharimonadales bacterium]|nr:hypothetical protein [Candidatus Saccharimonadales bacterium]
MYPNDNPQLPPDYLSQIAPSAPKKMQFSRTQIIVFGSILAILLITIVTVITSAILGAPKSEEKLAARLLTTEKIVSDAAPKIKSTQLKALNGNLKIYLTNTIRDITAPLAKDGITISKLNKSVVAAESGDEMLATLEDARLNVRYDRIYALEMSYQLNTVLTLMRQVQSNTKNDTFKTLLSDAIINLEPTQKAFADFNAANG